MKQIVIFGASGRTGNEVVAAAQKRDVKITVFNNRNPKLKELRDAVKKMDAVVIVFGPKPPYNDIFCAETTEKIVKAMEKEHVRRLICQTGAMIGEYRRNRSFLFEKFSGIFKKNNPASYKDRVDQEKVIKESFLQWTIIKPPRLTDNPQISNLIIGPFVQVGILSSVSRKSLGKLIIEEIIRPKYTNKIIFVKE